MLVSMVEAPQDGGVWSAHRSVSCGGLWDAGWFCGLTDWQHAETYLTSVLDISTSPTARGMTSQIAEVTARWVHCWVVTAPSKNWLCA